MAIEFKRTSYTGSAPTIWRGECKILPAGFKPSQEYPNGTVIRRGTLVSVDFDSLTASICKNAKVINGGTAKLPRVSKGHYFSVGDTISKVGDYADKATISAIDRTNDGYDVLTLSKSYTGLVADDVIVEVAEDADTTTSKYVPKYTPNGVIGADKEFNGRGLPTLDVAYEAVVLYANVPYSVLPEYLNGFCLKSNPNILFIKQ